MINWPRENRNDACQMHCCIPPLLQLYLYHVKSGKCLLPDDSGNFRRCWFTCAINLTIRTFDYIVSVQVLRYCVPTMTRKLVNAFLKPDFQLRTSLNTPAVAASTISKFTQ